RVAGDAHHALAERVTQLAAAQMTAFERPERRVPLPVRRDAVNDLLDHVPGLAESGHDPGDASEIGCDLDTADAVAVDERPPAAELLGPGVVEGVDQLAGEGAEP